MVRNRAQVKIAMLGQKAAPSRAGGVELVVTYLSAGMARRGHRVTCYNRERSAKGASWRGVALKAVPTIPLKGLAAASSSAIGALMCALSDNDVVHIHAEGPAFMAWLPKLFHKRVIVTVHGLDHQRAKWGAFARRYLLQGERNAVRYADEIVVLSENVRRYFLQTYQRETVLIPNGVPPATKRAPKLIAERFGLAGDDYILFLARLVPEKGLTYLIEAFMETETDKRLVVAGDTSDTDDYVAKVKRLAKDDERILFTGFVQGELLKELYSNAYLYCLPSDLEGMPLSLLEAMSYGNCCLVSDIDECKDVVGDAGVLFQKGDVDDLKRQLRRLLDEPETVARYKKEAAKDVCARFNWDDVVDRTLALYETTLRQE